MNLCRDILRFAAALVLIGATGCVEVSQSNRTTLGGGTSSSSETLAGGAGTDLSARAIGVSYAAYIRTNLLPCGTVPYDGESLPLSSPDGRFIAVQTGTAPTLETLLATAASSVPLATRVSIYRLVDDADELVMLEPLTTLGDGIMLGRSADATGFTVEAPQADGTRWIGKASWTGEVEWLVRDQYCNAFAALGPNGRLAYVRRGPLETQFSLIVRHGSGTTELAEEGADWLLPTFDSTGAGLFAFRLNDAGVLNIAYLRGENERAMRQSLREIRISTGAKLNAVYQSVAAQPAIVGAPQPAQPTFVFFHPAMLRMAVWRPFHAQRPTVALASESFAASIGPDGFITQAVDDRVIGRVLDGNVRTHELTENLFIPRRVASEEWPYLLFSPIRDQVRMKIVRMRLLPVE